MGGPGSGRRKGGGSGSKGKNIKAKRGSWLKKEEKRIVKQRKAGHL